MEWKMENGAVVEIKDLQKMRHAVKSRVKEIKPEASPKKGDSCGPTIESTFTFECLNANELGDAHMFVRMHHGQFVFNKLAGEWMRWNGIHWEFDILNQASIAVDDVAVAYLDEQDKISPQIREREKEIKEMHDDDDAADDAVKSDLKIKRMRGKQKALRTRASGLRGKNRRNNCLHMAHTCKNALAVRGDEFDQKPYLFPVKNGVVDLRTGRLMQGRQEDWLMTASPTVYDPDVPCPVWRQTLLDIYEDDQSVVDFMQRAFGMSIIGKVRDRAFIVLTGHKGQNGKGTILETAAKVFGTEFAKPLNVEMLLSSFNSRSSSGPSPDIMDLKGARLVWASETQEGAKIDHAQVKWLTGGDTLKGRWPNDKYPISFEPSHTLFLLTNHRPKADASDRAFWLRMHAVPHNLSFVRKEPQKDFERRADDQLEKKLYSEMSGILNWMVEGALMYLHDGLNPPPKILNETDEYQKAEDDLGAFIETCLMECPEDVTTAATKLYGAYTIWWKDYIGKFVPGQKKFGTGMKDRFPRVKKGTIHYRGICLNQDWEDRYNEAMMKGILK